MTLRQRILKFFYSPLVWFNKKRGKRVAMLNNRAKTSPAIPVYNLSVTLNNGESVPLDKYKGKKILIVNTASDCGYTGQYAELEKLHEQFQHKLQVLAFPANDFKEQEKGNDSEIESFCRMNYGIQFPLAKKSVVVKGKEQNEIFQWLTDPLKNGWNSKQPSWNFSKYLIDEEGKLTHYFDPAISPMDNVIIDALS